ncbi:MAG: glycosyltransferase [Deltaproteobacteria bacterium HGW-Deltaproteobacteria-2]|jgi:glycosyltransferase involved in cell wall biosynthesis|nr:MAG: glycosyltransferase [Deltaproteobacteria bacterium HGW-Deltaproteobacteria-2]
MIAKLPSPPPNKTGWPWTKESKPLPSKMKDGNSWPKISIVTPSYNQGQFLEETIRSVLLQNYPNLEYIIIDGGSADNSVEIIKKYEPWLTYWVSEKDNGQADAIYRGFEKATGEIIAWINSDDCYLPSAFSHVAKIFNSVPYKNLLIGSSYHVTLELIYLKKYYGFSQTLESLLIDGMQFSQPACFWKRNKFFELGGFDRKLICCFDYDMFLRFCAVGEFTHTLHPLAIYRHHSSSKTAQLSKISNDEANEIRKKYGAAINQCQFSQKSMKFPFQRTRKALWSRLTDLIFDPKWIFHHWI